MHLPITSFPLALIRRDYLDDHKYNELVDKYHGLKTWRWILLGLSMLPILFMLSFLAACCCARHRRRMGRVPMRGTAWMARPYNNPNATLPTMAQTSGSVPSGVRTPAPVAVAPKGVNTV